MVQMKVEEIGIKIRIERKKSGLSLEQLALKVGISAITPCRESKLERGSRHYPF